LRRNPGTPATQVLIKIPAGTTGDQGERRACERVGSGRYELRHQPVHGSTEGGGATLYLQAEDQQGVLPGAKGFGGPSPESLGIRQNKRRHAPTPARVAGSGFDGRRLDVPPAEAPATVPTGPP